MTTPSPEEWARRRRETREWLIEQGETPGPEWYTSEELIEQAQTSTAKFLSKFFGEAQPKNS